MSNMPNTNEPFSLNVSTDIVPDVTLEHDSTTDEVHIKFFNVDNEVVLDLWGQLNDVGPLISGLSTIAKYRALRMGLTEAVAEHDFAGAVECLKALKSLQLTSEFCRVFENVDVKTSTTRSCETPAEKDPKESPLPESDTVVLTGEEAEILLAMLDEKFNGK